MSELELFGDEHAMLRRTVRAFVNEPAHVHVERESSTCKFWLVPIELARSHGFSAHELTVIRRIIRAQHGKILEIWHEHCG